MMYTAQCGPDQHGGIGFQCISPNRFRFVVGSNCTRNSPWKKIADNFEVDIWYYIVGIYSSNNYMALYVNGERIGYLDSGIPQAYYNNLQYVGKDGRNSGKYKAHSYMDEIRIYNRAISKSEIKKLYAGYVK